MLNFQLKIQNNGMIIHVYMLIYCKYKYKVHIKVWFLHCCSQLWFLKCCSQRGGVEELHVVPQLWVFHGGGTTHCSSTVPELQFLPLGELQVRSYMWFHNYGSSTAVSPLKVITPKVITHTEPYNLQKY